MKPPSPQPEGSALEVLRAFFVLGLTSFGGPVAHFGYFRREFVEKRAWLSEHDYSGLLALCQFLPGPASSQTGFCIGLKRAGWRGGLAAWVGFTLPSALLMLALAHWMDMFQGMPMARGALHGLQLAAVAVVAQAVCVMARSLCPDTPRRALALLAAAILGLQPDTAGQILVLVIGAVIGRLALEQDRPAAPFRPAAGISLRTHRAALLCMLAFLVLLILAFLAPESGVLALFGAFYRAGALVFGGGHVVLPLLRDAVVVPGWISPRWFLAGYGAAQAVPGPLFTVAAFLGALASGGPGGLLGATVATMAIFLPGLLIVAATLPYWEVLRGRRGLASAMMGVNAAVVGLLGAALINLLTLSTMRSVWDLPITAAALLLLTVGRARPLLVVVFCAAAGMVL
ncbi:chromate transporter [Acidocella aquatica]|uniref:Chromate transporter n=1 Tax=Acidocella aquatica TaxID=1922313 RepID=A0ABQ6ADA9_9PROT|nr:chromate efflux transporter [Acidocella aquatica]GLR68030.1 chromate transporter [Acidocella aquatica]